MCPFHRWLLKNFKSKIALPVVKFLKYTLQNVFDVILKVILFNSILVISLPFKSAYHYRAYKVVALVYFDATPLPQIASQHFNKFTQPYQIKGVASNYFFKPQSYLYFRQKSIQFHSFKATKLKLAPRPPKSVRLRSYWRFGRFACHL